MSQKDNNIKFKKSVNNNPKINPQIQRDKYKAKIMDKYNVSLDEADRILSLIEKKEMESTYKNQNKKNKSQFNKPTLKKNNSSETNILQQVADKKNKVNSKNLPLNRININQKSTEFIEQKKDNYAPNSRKNFEIDSKENKSFKELEKSHSEISINNENPMKNNSRSVDSILGDIVSDYDQEISIKAEHIDLTFEVSDERIDTLKEIFIRTLKRDRAKKIKIHALKDVSFQINKGEKVGIIGYNGAGKSTLLSVIAGIYHPDKGVITTYGRIVPLLSLGAGFDPNFSGRRNIILNGAVLGYDKSFLESKIDEIIEFSELGEFIDIPIKNYSSGMLAKLGFSIATAVNPDILIIDEILGVGDVNFRKKSSDKLKSLMDSGTTVLIVSHSIPHIRNLCDKAIWIDKGSVRDIGEVNKVCDEYLKDAEKASSEELANIQLFDK